MNARAALLFSALLLTACGEPEIQATLSFSSPATESIHVSDTVTLQLVASTPDVLQIELRRNGQTLANLVPPFQYVWDTRAEPEGAHELIAFAVVEERELQSAPLQVIIDRTAPRVAAVTPDESNPNVWPMDPVTVTFTEPLDPRTLEDAAHFFIGAQGRVAADATLSEDGTTLTFQPALSPGSTTEWTLAIEGLRDLAGNPVPARQLAWRIPRWQRPTAYLDTDGNMLTRALPMDIALDASNRPVVAFIELHQPYNPSFGYTDRRLHVHRWTGTDWVALGEQLGAHGDDDSAEVGTPSRYSHVGEAAMVLDANDRPVVAWTEQQSPGGTYAVHVARWEGSRWSLLGGPISAVAGATDAFAVSLALDPEGAPVVAFVETVTVNQRNIYVRRWDGSEWQAVGTPVNNGTTGSMRALLALDIGADGTLAVAYLQNQDAVVTPSTVARAHYAVLREGGAGWNHFSVNAETGPSSAATDVRLRVDAHGNRYMAWIEADGAGRSRVYAGTWTALGSGPWFVAGHGEFASGLGGLHVDADGRVLLSWVDDSSAIHLERWSGGRLERVASGLSSHSGPVRLNSVRMAASSGVAALTFMSQGLEYAVEVARTTY